MAQREPIWRCYWPKCEAWKQAVTPIPKGRCPHCGHTVVATWPEERSK